MLQVTLISRVSALVISVLTMSICLILAIATSARVKPRSELENSISELGSFLAQTYRIKISFKFRSSEEREPHDPISATSAELDEIEWTLRLLKSELGRYPRDLIRTIMFKKIIICKSLTQSGRDSAAISDFNHDVLFFGVEEDGEGEEFKRRNIHHEIFHMIDARADGTFEDPAWEELNSSNFRYHSGHNRDRQNIPGFLSVYAMKDAAEDKAELFSFLMTDYDIVLNRAHDDPVIMRKLQEIESQLLKFSPDLYKSLWDRRLGHKSGVQAKLSEDR